MRTPADLDVLEARTLLASTETFTDGDGDRVTVKVSGNGQAVLTLTKGLDTQIAFIELVGTDARSSLSISVKKQGAGDGRVRLEGMSDAVLGQFNAPTTDIFGADFVVDQITRFRCGTLSGASVDLDPPPDKALRVDIARTQSNCDLFFGGDIAVFKVGSTTAADFITIAGRLASLTVATGLSGQWEADHYGGITLKAGIMTAKMRANTPDAKGYSFGAFKAPQVINGELEPEDGVGTLGRIKSITAGVWTGGEVRATGIDTLKVNSDFEPTLVQLTSTPPGQFSIRSGTIGEEFSGTLNFDGPIRTLTIGRTTNAVLNGAGSLASIGTLTFNGEGFVDGEFVFATLGRLSSSVDLEGNWRATQLDENGLSIGTIRAPSIDDFILDESTPGGIGSVSASIIENATFGCAFINTISLKRGAHGGEGQGDIGSETAFNLHGSNAAGFSLGRLTAAGAMSDSSIVAEGNIDRITVGSLDSTRIAVGFPIASKFLFDSLTGFDTLAFINRVSITNTFSTGAFGLLNSTIQCATIHAITVTPRIETSNIDIPFGFGAITFGTISLKNALGQTVKPPAPTVPGDTEPLGVPGSDFVLRKFA